jgi:hypothetical protein
MAPDYAFHYTISGAYGNWLSISLALGTSDEKVSQFVILMPWSLVSIMFRW